MNAMQSGVLPTLAKKTFDSIMGNRENVLVIYAIMTKCLHTVLQESTPSSMAASRFKNST